MRRALGSFLVAALAAGCGSTANVAQEREALMRIDQEWGANTTNVDKFMSYYAANASVYPAGSPVVTGTAAIREMVAQMMAAPGFALEFAPTRAEVSASGETGYTIGTYRSSAGGVTEKGKYVTIWTKQADGQWKVTNDIFNADAAPSAAHAMIPAETLTWIDPPPTLPPGAKLAVVAGDPSQPAPFVLRAHVPAGYKIMPHWHPTDENVTILSGTVALGMGESWDDKKLQSLSTGGYAIITAEMRHFFMARTPATFQIHGMGPFAVNYVNPADDPSKAKK